MGTNIQDLKDAIGNAVQDYINDEFSESGEDTILDILTEEELHEDDIKYVLSDVIIIQINHNMPGYLPDNAPVCLYIPQKNNYSEEIREALLGEVDNLIEDYDEITDEQYNATINEVKEMTKEDLSDNFSFYLPNNYVIEFTKVSALEVLNNSGVDWQSAAIENQSQPQKP